MKNLYPIFIKWLPFAVVTTLTCALVFIAIQQNMRLNANDPQIEIAEDGAQLLGSGQPPEIFGAGQSVDISHSLLPFVIVYDTNGKVLNSTGSLNGSAPIIPIGTLLNAQTKGENRVTWQPSSGVRIAAVIVPYKGTKSGYILVGKSLREVEARLNTIILIAFLAWIAGLLSTFALVALDPASRKENLGL